MLHENVDIGNFLRRIRGKVNVSQDQWARAIGLKTREAVANIEKRDTASMQPATEEALLELLGYQSIDDLIQAARDGIFPSISAIRAKIRTIQDRTISDAFSSLAEFDEAEQRSAIRTASEQLSSGQLSKLAGSFVIEAEWRARHPQKSDHGFGVSPNKKPREGRNDVRPSETG